MEKTFLNHKIGIILCILFLNFSCLIVSINAQKDMYQEILKQAKGIQDEPKEEEAKVKRNFEKSAISPQVVGRFFCDPEVKVNTVRQDVMTINNYNK